MTNDASRGFILIADITGYTAFLDESELEHAQGTLTDLLGLLVEHTRLLRQRMPFPGAPTHTLIDFRLEATEGGTKLDQTITKPTGTPLKRSLARAMIKMRAGRVGRDMTFRDRIQDDLSAGETMPASPFPISLEHIDSAAAASIQPDK